MTPLSEHCLCYLRDACRDSLISAIWRKFPWEQTASWHFYDSSLRKHQGCAIFFFIRVVLTFWKPWVSREHGTSSFLVKLSFSMSIITPFSILIVRKSNFFECPIGPRFQLNIHKFWARNFENHLAKSITLSLNGKTIAKIDPRPLLGKYDFSEGTLLLTRDFFQRWFHKRSLFDITITNILKSVIFHGCKFLQCSQWGSVDIIKSIKKTVNHYFINCVVSLKLLLI